MIPPGQQALWRDRLRQIDRINGRFWGHATLAILAAITVLSLIPLPPDHGTGVALNNDKVQHLIACGAATLPAALARQPGGSWCSPWHSGAAPSNSCSL